jgi:hypothetical protein
MSQSVLLFFDFFFICFCCCLCCSTRAPSCQPACVMFAVQIELLTTLQLHQARQAMQTLLMASDISLLTSKFSGVVSAGVQFRPPHLDVDVLQIAPTWSQTLSTSSELASGRANAWTVVLCEWQRSRLLTDPRSGSASSASAASSSAPRSLWSAKLASSVSPLDMLAAMESIEQVVHGNALVAAAPVVREGERVGFRIA